MTKSVNKVIIHAPFNNCSGASWCGGGDENYKGRTQTWNDAIWYARIM